MKTTLNLKMLLMTRWMILIRIPFICAHMIFLCSQIFLVNLMIIFCKLNRLMLRIEMIGVDENYTKPEPKDASYDNMDNFNEDTCEVCLYDAENLFIYLKRHMRLEKQLTFTNYLKSPRHNIKEV